MTKDELAVMDGGKCILQLRGVRPFYSKKFDITAHKRYKELSDFDKKNAFDAGMDGHIAKPISIDAIAKTVNEVLTNKNASLD